MKSNPDIRFQDLFYCLSPFGHRDIIIENQPIFNIELPESKRYDQKDNWRCWIFGGLNLIKHNIAKNLDMNVMDLELSNNHIAFYDIKNAFAAQFNGPYFGLSYAF